jgi:predicted RNase H-like HicB family nuclease
MTRAAHRILDSIRQARALIHSGSLRVHGHRVELCQTRAGNWLATVPELPGVIAEGETVHEAVANVAAAISSWLDSPAEASTPGRLQP